MLGGLGAGFAIIALLIAWQFHRGPVSLGFLAPYVEQALNSGHRSFRLAISETTLTWAGWDRAIDIRVKNVRAVGDGGQVIARIPELSLSLSGRALLNGVLAPRFIELLGPELRVRRLQDGTLDVDLAGTSGQDGGLADGLLKWLVQRPEPGSPMSYLSSVHVSGATMTFEDRLIGKTWTAPVGYLHLDRAPHGLLATGLVRIDVDGRSADISLHGSYRTDGERLDMTASFADISPASFSSIYYMLGPMSALALPLSGTVVIGLKRDGTVETIGFNVKGGRGDVELPAPFTQPLPVKQLALRGIVNGLSRAVVIDEFTVDLMPGANVTVPAPISHPFPVTRVAGAGRFAAETGRLDIADLKIELDGPHFAAKGTVEGIGTGGGIALKLSTGLYNVVVDDVAKYWPPTLGPDPRVWVTARLRNGKMTAANADIDVAVKPTGELAIHGIDGTMSAEGVTVDYLKGMPPVTDAAALMTFDERSFDVAVLRGRSGSVNIAGGTIHFSGLQEFDQFADVDIRLEAPFAAALKYIDHKPLEFARAMGLSAEKAEGDAEVDLHLRFLLAKNLKMDDVEVNAAALLRKVSIDNVVLGRGVRDGELKLDVDKKGMDVAGKVRMGSIPVGLNWRQNFQPNAPFKSFYTMAAKIGDIGDVRDLGVDLKSFVGDVVKGGADATVRYTIFDRRSSRLEIDADIANSELRMPLLDWRKPTGAPGRAGVTILIENKTIKSVPRFDVTAGDLDVRGDIVYSPAGTGLERINFSRLAFGRTNVTGALISQSNGTWEVGLQGDELDFSPLWDRFIHEKPGGKNDVKIPNLTIAVELKKMWIDRSRYLGKVSGTFAHRDDVWRTFLLDSRMNGEHELKIDLHPDASGNRILNVKAADGGAALQFLDLYEQMRGGALEIRGRYDDAAPGRPLHGKMRVENYRIQNAPILARVLSVMALTGIADVLSGEGLNFAELDIPFTYSEGVLEITDARAAGASLGFTAGGKVYTYADVIDLKGTVVPAYALNSLLGKIPILGEILTGTEKGGGMFAANFQLTGPLEDPKATVNPLSALTPGILRNVLGSFDKPEEPKTDLRLLAPTQ